jgi:ribosome-binding factor A
MSRRTEKVSHQIIRELSEIVRDELVDPRIGFVTFTHAEVSPDLSQARIYFTVLGSEKERKSTYYALKHASSFLKNALKHRIRLRRIPELEFVYDESVDRGMKIFEKIVEVQSAGNKEDEDAD